VLPEVRRSYALSMDGNTYLGAARALQHYVERTAQASNAQLRNVSSSRAK
jgi:hypothetical protein